MKSVTVPLTLELLDQLALAVEAAVGVDGERRPLLLQLTDGPVFDSLEVLSQTGITKLARFVRDVPVDAAGEADENGTLDWRQQL